VVEPEVRFLTVPEVTRLLRISRATLYRIFDRGELRRVQVGSRRVVIPVADVEAYIARAERCRFSRGQWTCS